MSLFTEITFMFSSLPSLDGFKLLLSYIYMNGYQPIFNAYWFILTSFGSLLIDVYMNVYQPIFNLYWSFLSSIGLFFKSVYIVTFHKLFMVYWSYVTSFGIFLKSVYMITFHKLFMIYWTFITPLGIFIKNVCINIYMNIYQPIFNVYWSFLTLLGLFLKGVYMVTFHKLFMIYWSFMSSLATLLKNPHLITTQALANLFWSSFNSVCVFFKGIYLVTFHKLFMIYWSFITPSGIFLKNVYMVTFHALFKIYWAFVTSLCISLKNIYMVTFHALFKIYWSFVTALCISLQNIYIYIYMNVYQPIFNVYWFFAFKLLKGPIYVLLLVFNWIYTPLFVHYWHSLIWLFSFFKSLYKAFVFLVIFPILKIDKALLLWLNGKSSGVATIYSRFCAGGGPNQLDVTPSVNLSGYLDLFRDFIDSLATSIFSNLLYITVIDFFFIFFYCFLIFRTVDNSIFRKKLPYFLLFIVNSVCWLFYASFDGLGLFLAASEFLIILLLMIVSFTSNFSRKESVVSIVSFRFIILFNLLIYTYCVYFSFSGYAHLSKFLYTGMHDLVSSDLYVYFYNFFIYFPAFVIYITLILSFFSIFFVLFYFTLKKGQQYIFNDSQFTHILRKQDALHQSVFNPQIRTFCQEEFPTSVKNIDKLLKELETPDTKYVPKRKFFDPQWF